MFGAVHVLEVVSSEGLEAHRWLTASDSHALPLSLGCTKTSFKPSMRERARATPFPSNLLRQRALVSTTCYVQCYIMTIKPVTIATLVRGTGESGASPTFITFPRPVGGHCGDAEEIRSGMGSARPGLGDHGAHAGPFSQWRRPRSKSLPCGAACG